MRAKIQPGLWWLAIAPAIWVVGVGGGVWWLLRAYCTMPVEAVRFVGPCRVTVQVDHPGVYVLWHDAVGIHEGRRFENPGRLPEEMTIRVGLAGSGEELTPEGTIRAPRKSEGRVQYRVGRYRVEEPGDYEVLISGGGGQRLFSLEASHGGSLTVAAAICGLLNLLGWGGAFTVALLVLSRRARARNLLAGSQA